MSTLKDVTKGFKEIYDSGKEFHIQEPELFKKIHSLIFKEFNKVYGVLAKDISYHDGYFIFGRGENTIAHYSFDEVPQWKFATWLDIVKDDSNEKKYVVSVEVFAQMTLFIDKFKPSRSDFLSSFKIYYNRETENFEDSNYEYELLRFNMIFKHKYLAMYAELNGTDYNLFRQRPLLAYFSVKKDIRRELDRNKWQLKLNNAIMKKSKKFFKKYFKDIYYEYEFHDRGENWSPRWDIYITLENEEILTDELYKDLFEKWNDWKSKTAKKYLPKRYKNGCYFYDEVSSHPDYFILEKE